MPVCFELNNWNFVDLEQDKNNTAHRSNKYFLIGYVIIITIICSNPAKIKKKWTTSKGSPLYNKVIIKYY